LFGREKLGVILDVNKKNEATVWVITTVFDRFDSLSQFLKCINDQTYKNLNVVLVDHGVKNVVDHITLEPNVKVIKASTELWWTGAVNTGLNYVVNNSVSPDDYVLLQNDDSTFNKYFVEHMVKAIEKHDKAIVGSVAVDRERKKIIHCNMKFNLRSSKYIYCHRGEIVDELKDEFYESDVLKGRGVLFPVSVFREIGLLEEKLPQYKSDHEITHRANKNGFKLIVTPLAITETLMDTQQRAVKGRLFHSLKLISTSRRSTSNLKDAFIYYYKCFSFPLSLYLFIVHSLRTVAVIFLRCYRS